MIPTRKPLHPPLVPPPPAAPPKPKPAGGPSKPEPEVPLFQRALHEARTLEIRLMDGEILVARLISWGMYSIYVEVLSSDKGGEVETPGAGQQVIYKHAIARVRLWPR